MKIGDVITFDKDILGGIPVFNGTRVPVKNLFDYLKAGDSLSDFLNDFDYITKESCIFVLKTSEELLVGTMLGSAVKKKPSDFKGMLNLTDDQYQDFQTHLKDIRNECDNNLI